MLCYREVKNKIKSVTEEMESLRQENAELQSTTRQTANRRVQPAVPTAHRVYCVLVLLMTAMHVRYRCEMIEETREGRMQKNERYLKAKEEELAKREQ